MIKRYSGLSSIVREGSGVHGGRGEVIRDALSYWFKGRDNGRKDLKGL